MAPFSPVVCGNARVLVRLVSFYFGLRFSHVPKCAMRRSLCLAGTQRSPAIMPYPLFSCDHKASEMGVKWKAKPGPVPLLVQHPSSASVITYANQDYKYKKFHCHKPGEHYALVGEDSGWLAAPASPMPGPNIKSAGLDRIASLEFHLVHVCEGGGIDKTTGKVVDKYVALTVPIDVDDAEEVTQVNQVPLFDLETILNLERMDFDFGELSAAQRPVPQVAKGVGPVSWKDVISYEGTLTSRDYVDYVRFMFLRHHSGRNLRVSLRTWNNLTFSSGIFDPPSRRIFQPDTDMAFEKLKWV